MADLTGRYGRALHCLLLGSAALLLIGAATPANPPVPEEKPAAREAEPAAPEAKPAVPEAKPSPPGTETTPPAPPDAGETPPVPKKRPAPPPGDSGENAAPAKTGEAEPAAKTGDKPDAETSGGEKQAPDATDQPAAGEDEEAEPPSEEEQEAEQKPEPDTPGVPEDTAELAACYRALDALGVTYERKPAVNDPGACGIQYPVSVSRILPDVTLKPANLMRCKTALALARWTKTFVEPAAETLGNEVRLTGLSQGSAYVCRLRNNADHGKISEHAFGNAVDVVTFEFSGHDPISIAPRERTGELEEGFQRAIVGTACLYFTTVLGPHADEAHQDNLHLDVIERGSGFRLCE